MTVQDPSSTPGPGYEVDIEGQIYPWTAPTITVPQLRTLASIPSGVPMLEIDADNEQHQLPEDAVIELKPGHGFSKKIKFKRGHR